MSSITSTAATATTGTAAKARNHTTTMRSTITTTSRARKAVNTPQRSFFRSQVETRQTKLERR